MAGFNPRAAYSINYNTDRHTDIFKQNFTQTTFIYNIIHISLHGYVGEENMEFSDILAFHYDRL